MRYVLCLFAGVLFPVAAWGQYGLGGCPSSLRVTAGMTALIDCALQTGSYTYQWTSKDPSWLVYLSDVKAAAPRFHAPVEDGMPRHITYSRLVYDDDGAIVDQELISITVHPLGEPAVSNGVRGSWLEGKASTVTASDEVSEPVKSEVPFLSCIPRVTVRSGRWQRSNVPVCIHRGDCWRTGLNWTGLRIARQDFLEWERLTILFVPP